MRNIVLASFDPGGTTGFTILELLNGKGFLRASGQFPRSTGLNFVQNELYKYACAIELVYENFIVVNVKNNNVDSLKVIGAIEFWKTTLLDADRIPLTSQMPGERCFVEKRFSTPFPHVASHARSSLLHGMAYLFKHYELTNYDFNERGIQY